MSLNDALKEKLMDIRLRDKLLAEGKVTESDLKKYLGELVDDTDLAMPLYPEKTDSDSDEE